MFNITTKSINWGGKELSLETGRIARQADGAVLIKYAGTTVLCTACAKKEPKEGVDFFPLTVTYQEKQYAAGKIQVVSSNVKLDQLRKKLYFLD